MAVSNRVPASGRSSPAGGLAVALEDALRRTGGLWFGWSGRTGDAETPSQVDRGGYRLATIPLSRSQVSGYYENFANGALWPLFHGRADISRFDAEDWRCYREVNAVFAAGLGPLLRDDDVIWVHDYHLIPLAAELRRSFVKARIGFFLHIPFPHGDLLSALPWARDLLRDLAAYDLIGVQTDNDRNNLIAAMERIAGGRRVDGSLRLGSRPVRVATFPIGIDPDRIAGLAASAPARRLTERMKAVLEENLLIVGAERLDYSKGLPQRLQAFETLLRRETDLRGRVTFLQVAAPSRENVTDYAELRAELESLTGRINALCGRLDWVPVRYFNQAFSQTRLAALFRMARVGCVTPLRDGMNLVAKEFVAAQDPEDPGVLVLSEFAGAAERLTEALIVNPHDRDGMADALRQAIDMPLAERRRRWEACADVVWRENVHAWSRNVLAAIEAAAPARKGSLPIPAGPAVAAETLVPGRRRDAGPGAARPG